RAPRVPARRTAPHGIQDQPVLIDEDEIAAPTHRFYNEQNLVVLAGGVALFAVQLEHTLQGWLAEGTDTRIAQVLADYERERGVALEATRRQARQALHPTKFRMSRKQHEATT